METLELVNVISLYEDFKEEAESHLLRCLAILAREGLVRDMSGTIVDTMSLRHWVVDTDRLVDGMVRFERYGEHDDVFSVVEMAWPHFEVEVEMATDDPEVKAFLDLGNAFYLRLKEFSRRSLGALTTQTPLYTDGGVEVRDIEPGRWVFDPESIFGYNAVFESDHHDDAVKVAWAAL